MQADSLLGNTKQQEEVTLKDEKTISQAKKES